MNNEHLYSTTEKHALQLVSIYCRFSAGENRKAASLELQMACLQRGNWQRNSDNWNYKNAHQERHAHHVDMCRRAAELVELYGIRTPKNSYPVTL